MKLKNLIAIAGLILLFASCKKESSHSSTTAKVIVMLDYLGSGGYYNDNIDGVPSGLTLGANGPFTVSTTKAYTMVYKANDNFPETSISNWTPTPDRTWVIHCYVNGNLEHIETYPQ